MLKLYVGNLPYNMGDEELRVLFDAHGQVESARVITDRDTGRSRGFGFVEMPNDGEARKAIEALAETEVGGRRLVVNEARPREDRGGRRGGGGGGGRGGYGDRRNRW